MAVLASLAPAASRTAGPSRPRSRSVSATAILEGSGPQRGVADRRAVLFGGIAGSFALTRPGRADAADGVSFTLPKDGSKVTNPVKVKMEVSGLELKPAAEGLIPGSGHHHIIVDGSSMAEGEQIPFDTTHLHFGKAQTEATFALEPGMHTLTLQFADAEHKSYGPAFSKTISVNVSS